MVTDTEEFNHRARLVDFLSANFLRLSAAPTIKCFSAASFAALDEYARGLSINVLELKSHFDGETWHAMALSATKKKHLAMVRTFFSWEDYKHLKSFEAFIAVAMREIEIKHILPPPTSLHEKPHKSAFEAKISLWFFTAGLIKSLFSVHQIRNIVDPTWHPKKEWNDVSYLHLLVIIEPVRVPFNAVCPIGEQLKKHFVLTRLPFDYIRGNQS